ncbi:MAG: hypothetical protein AAFP02_25780, partial [Bacteroidota bacterium]
MYNPSFEDMPRASRQPRGWLNCGWSDESPPDVQPDTTFAVSQEPYHGKTYLGMVTRDNDTWESIGQRLSKELEPGQCYSFSVFLARSRTYISISQATGQRVNYDTPSVLRIWGGVARCDRRELLAETSRVDHSDWREYKFKFSPTQLHTYIMFEVTYKMPVLLPTNGNLLVDHASAIVPMPCELEEPVPTRPEADEPPVLAANTSVPKPPQPKVENNPAPQPNKTNTVKPTPTPK